MRRGFTLIELLIVIAIIALLIVFSLINLRGQNARAADVRRKADLYKLGAALEEYVNDHDSFPLEDVVNSCGSAALAPYLAQIPCDPQTAAHYGYFQSAATGGYRVCAKLADTSDPAIASAGCGGPDGCGLGGGYNYCLASGTTASAVGTSDQIFVSGSTPTPTPTSGPTPTPTPAGTPTNHYACTPATSPPEGICNYYYDPLGPPPLGGSCPISWETGCPAGLCAISENRCLY